MIPAGASLRGYSPRVVSYATGKDCGTEDTVQQQFIDEVDINTIVRRFGLTHEAPGGISGGVYGDFTGISDYHSAVAAVEKAREGFMALDPELREKFGNDPGAYLEYVDTLTDEEVEEVFIPPREPVAPVAPVAPVSNPPSEGSGSAAT